MGIFSINFESLIQLTVQPKALIDEKRPLDEEKPPAFKYPVVTGYVQCLFLLLLPLFPFPVLFWSMNPSSSGRILYTPPDCVVSCIVDVDTSLSPFWQVNVTQALTRNAKSTEKISILYLLISYFYSHVFSDLLICIMNMNVFKKSDVGQDGKRD